MTANPRVSVIIPCYNYGRFLNESLASVASQTLKPIETLIIDDGSTDPETIAILHDLSTPGTKIIRQDNHGLAGARNSGIRHSRGDYVYFLDADDVLFPDCLEKLAGLLEQSTDAIAACCGVKPFGGEQDGTEWRACYYPYLILVENTWAAGLMLRKQSLEELSLWYDESMCNGYEDWEFNIRLAQTGRPIEIHPGALYHYRLHPHSMLVSSRNRHVELVSYIRKKHPYLFAAEKLQKLKQSDFPGLAVPTNAEDQLEMAQWLASQSFQDYIVVENDNNSPVRYRLLHAGVAAANRLPPEAIECAIVNLESNHDHQFCVLAVRLNGTELSLGTAWRHEMCQPVAIVTRAHFSPPALDSEINPDNIENILCFSNQIPGSNVGWNPLGFNREAIRKSHLRDPVSIRKWLSSKVEKLFGPRIKACLVSLYDFVYYRLLFTESANRIRNKLERPLGKRREIILARIFYGAFLALPPARDEQTIRMSALQQIPDPPPLFFNAESGHATKITVLIVTAWLNQGGVEQEIIDLCTYVDQSRFKIILATTRRSSHPWERILRSAGASIYHLADFLSPQRIRYGLAHLILQHGVEVMHIVHSREAYESLPFIKRVCPFLAVSDRNVTRPGGFPKFSARMGRKHIDVRTVGHQRLARQMSESYGLATEKLRVIYAGTDERRLQQVFLGKPHCLHSLCDVSDDVPIVLYMGRLDREKRPDVFVKVAAKICQMRPDCSAHFAMAGDGEMRRKTQALIAKLGVNKRIHMLGFQLNRHRLLSDSAILMIPSRYEGLALVSFEAMAVGTPQISADVGGQSEVITAEIGILIKNGIGEIARYASACIELLYDPERRERMSRASRSRYTKQYSTEHCVNAYSLIFQDLAELSRHRALKIPSLRPPHINPLRAFE